MARERRQRKPHPVCKQHYQKMRKEALAALPFWSRPLGAIKINQMLRDKGFVQSDTECTFCKTGTDVDKVE